MRTLDKIISLTREARLAKRLSGKGILNQIVEIARLKGGAGRLGVTEYYDLQLYASQAGDGSTVPYIGRRVSALLDQRLNANQSRVLANDKIVCYSLLQLHGVPIPLTYATYSPTGRSIGAERCLRSPQEAVDYLATEAAFPLFVKPVSGTYGRLARKFVSIDMARQSIECADGSLVSIKQFQQELGIPQLRGFLFQEPLQNAQTVAQVIGDTLSTVRMIAVVGEHGPVLHTAFWKVAVGQNMTDNFSHGKHGNLLCGVDADTGEITTAISRLGADGQVASHPTTGQPLIGYTLPFWNDARRLVLDAARHFPALRIQNWDVAFCDAGPVLIELNTEADLEIPQVVMRRSFLDDPAAKTLQEAMHGAV